MIKDTDNKLFHLHEKAKPVFEEFLTKIQEKGYNVIVNGVIYTLADGIRLHKEDSRNPEWSYHTFGFALDINLQSVDTNRVYKKLDPLDDWLKTGIKEIVEELKLLWGGNAYKTYYDPIHVEYEIMPFDQLKKLGIDQFGISTEVEYNKILIP